MLDGRPTAPSAPGQTGFAEKQLPLQTRDRPAAGDVASPQPGDASPQAFNSQTKCASQTNSGATITGVHAAMPRSAVARRR
jgi:hypothetical protein